MLTCFNVQKHIIFQILYIILVPLCPASLKHLIFYKAPPSNKCSLLWLVNWPSALWLAEHYKHCMKCNRVAWQTQWWCSYVFAVFCSTPLWCDPVPLTHTHTHTHTHTPHTRTRTHTHHTHTHMTRYVQNSAFKQSIANTWTNNKTYLQSLIQKHQIVIKSELILFLFL